MKPVLRPDLWILDRFKILDLREAENAAYHLAPAKPTLSAKIRAIVARRCASSASPPAGLAKSSATNVSPVAHLRQSARNFVSNPTKPCAIEW